MRTSFSFLNCLLHPVRTLALALVVSCGAETAFAQDSTKTAEVPDRALPAPLNSPPFPSGDWVGTYKLGAWADAPDYALQQALGWADNKSRIKIYGWVNPAVNFSTSKHSNIPISYDIQPNSLQLQQAVLRIERQPNTVQTDHIDWGFRLSNVYGLDYRYTVAKGWFDNQYFKKNGLYGYDAPEAYVMVYVPKVAQGMLLRIGRFISPADIEAQLSPDNYLATHSVMFSYDPFTETGVQSTIMLNKQWTVEFALDAGNDMAPWTTSSRLTGQAFVRYVSKNNNNSIWAGLNEIGRGKFVNGHDNLNQASAVWGHKFSDKVHMMTEAYYEWERDAALGGSASDGPVRYGAGGGTGPILPGVSGATGFVNYFMVQTSAKSYLCLRNDLLGDKSGWRTGFPTTYVSHTVGFVQQFTPWLMLRHEVRYDYNLDNTVAPYDLGAARHQVVGTMDMVVRF